MAALNFPDPNVQTSYTNPNTGITYEWSNGIWKAARTAQTAPELFVDVDGDNLTGNLTLGTDKIVLNATTGAATFASRLSPGTSSLNDHALVASNNNAANATLIAQNYNDSGLLFKGYNSSNDTVTINADGSATFAGDLRSTTTVTCSDNVINTAFLNQHGLQVRSSTGPFLKGEDVSANQKVLISADGSATFTGIVKSDHSIEVYNRRVETGKGGAVIGLAGKDTASERGFMTLYANTLVEPAFRIMTAANDTDSKTVKVGFYNDGSASFAGGQLLINSTGSLRLGNPNSFVSGGNVILGEGGTGLFTGNVSIKNSSGTSTTIFLSNDGDATFIGNITAGNVSDIKFKENIEAAPSQLSDISAFELKTFDWKDEAPISDELKEQRKLGLIAQEVEAICPEMVYEVTGQDDDSYKAINHDVLIMKLLGAVKELAAEVADLKAS